MIYLVSNSYLLFSVLDVLSTYSSASIWSEFVKLANLLSVFTELSGTLVIFMFLSVSFLPLLGDWLFFLVLVRDLALDSLSVGFFFVVMNWFEN